MRIRVGYRLVGYVNNLEKISVLRIIIDDLVVFENIPLDNFFVVKSLLYRKYKYHQEEEENYRAADDNRVGESLLDFGFFPLLGSQEVVEEEETYQGAEQKAENSYLESCEMLLETLGAIENIPVDYVHLVLGAAYFAVNL